MDDSCQAFESGYKTAFPALTTVLAAEKFKVRGSAGHHFSTFYALGVLHLPKRSDLTVEVESHRVGWHTMLSVPKSVSLGPVWDALRGSQSHFLLVPFAYLHRVRLELAHLLGME